jgi:hypothetical protein
LWRLVRNPSFLSAFPPEYMAFVAVSPCFIQYGHTDSWNSSLLLVHRLNDSLCGWWSN